MPEYIKIDKAMIKLKGFTFSNNDGHIGLLTLTDQYPPKCIGLFVDKAYWDEIKDRIYA